MRSRFDGSAAPAARVPFLGTTLVVLSLLTAPALAEWSGGIEGGAVSRGGESATRLRVRLDESTRPLTQSLYAEWLSYADGNGYRAGYVPLVGAAAQVGLIVLHHDTTLHVIYAQVAAKGGLLALLLAGAALGWFRKGSHVVH